MKFEAVKADYENLWGSMEIKPSMAKTIDWAAAKVLDGRSRYAEIATKTGVPWYVVGLIHLMESGCRWNCHLHNGDPLSEKTKLVPKGRPAKGDGPFTWEESAVDCLVLKGYDKVVTWDLPMVAYALEKNNGWGYRTHHPEVASPYLWSGTTHYARGKYVEDGKWNGTFVSEQAGAMPVLWKMCQLVPEIGFASSAPKKAEPPAQTTPESYRSAEKPSPVVSALKGRTVLSQLIALFGAVLLWFGSWAETLAQVGLAAVEQMTKLDGLSKLSPQAKYMSGAVTVLAIVLAIYARMDDAKGGKR